MGRAARWTLGSFAILFAAIGAYSEAVAPSKAPLVMYIFVLFCLAIAVACLSKRLRDPALRVISAITFLTTIAYLVYEIRTGLHKPYTGTSQPHRINAIFALLAFGIPGCAIAIHRKRSSWKEKHLAEGSVSHGPENTTNDPMTQ